MFGVLEIIFLVYPLGPPEKKVKGPEVRMFPLEELLEKYFFEDEKQTHHKLITI